MKWLPWAVAFLVSALLWAWSGFVALFPWMLWTNDAHYRPADVFLNPAYLAVLVPSVLGAVGVTVLTLQDRGRQK